MKKPLFILVIILIVVNVFGELPRTRTIGFDTLSAIREACAGDDPLIQHYYLDYKGNRREDEETGDDIYDDGIYRETFNTGNYVKQSFLGVIDVELSFDCADSVYLENSYRHLFDPTFEDEFGNSLYLSISAVIEYFESGGNKDVLSLSSTLENLAFIVDMLWWYEAPGYETQEQFQEDLSAKLDSLAGCVLEEMEFDFEILNT